MKSRLQLCGLATFFLICALSGCSGKSSSVALPNQPSNYEEKRKLIEQNTQLKPEQKQLELARLDAMEKARTGSQ